MVYVATLVSDHLESFRRQTRFWNICISPCTFKGIFSIHIAIIVPHACAFQKWVSCLGVVKLKVDQESMIWAGVEVLLITDPGIQLDQSEHKSEKKNKHLVE